MANNWFSNLLPAIENVGTNIAQAAQANPVAKFLIGGAMNTANDIGAGISANQTAGVRDTANNSALAQAKILTKQIAKEKDPAKRQALFQQSTDLANSVDQGSQDVASTFSPDVEQNPLWRGLKTGVEVATGADIAAHPLQTLKGAAQVIRHPIKTAQSALDAVQNIDKLPEIMSTEMHNPDNFKLTSDPNNPLTKLGNRALASQYKGAGKVVSSPAATTGALADYGLTSPDDVAKAAPQVTGKDGIVNKLVTDAVKKAGPINIGAYTSADGTPVPQISDVAQGLLDNEETLGQAAEKKVMANVTKAITKSTVQGGDIAGGDPTQMLDTLRDWEAKGYAKVTPGTDGEAVANVYKGLANDLKSRLFVNNGADSLVTQGLLSPDDYNSLAKIHPQLAENVKNAKTVGELRSLQSPFVQGSQMVGANLRAAGQGLNIPEALTGSAAVMSGNPALAAATLAQTGGGKELIGNTLRAAGGLNSGEAQPFISLTGQTLDKLTNPVNNTSANGDESQNTYNHNLPPIISSGSTSSIAQDVNSQPIPTSANDIKPLADGSIQPINPYTYKGPDGQTIAISKGEYNSQLSTYKNQITALNKEMSENPRDFDIQKSNPSKIAAINSQIDSLNSRNETSRALDEPYKNGLIVTSTLSKAKQQIADGGSDILKANGNLNTLATISNGKYSKLAAVLKNLQDTTGVPIFQPGMSPDVIRGNVDQAGKISLYNTYYSYFPSQTGGAQPVAPTSVLQGTLPAINSTYNAPQVPVGQAQSRSGSFQAFQPDPSIRANLGLPPIQ